jgi:RNA polymerase sigma factor (sigma-70 family)
MEQAARAIDVTAEDRRIDEAIEREQRRLRNFIRTRVADIDDAEDILQDVFFELVEATRLMKPIANLSGWLFRVARNRITDRFRRKRADQSTDEPIAGEANLFLEDLLPSPDAGPEAAYARQVLLQELDAALDELPDEQRDVFIAHEIEGHSFKDLAEDTGLSINTLLARKHYAVVRLRRRLQAIYDEFRTGRGERQ